MGLGLGPSVGQRMLVRVLEVLDGCLVEVDSTRVIAAAQSAVRWVFGMLSPAFSVCKMCWMGVWWRWAARIYTHI